MLVAMCGNGNGSRDLTPSTASLYHRNPLPEVKSYIDSELRVELFERFQIAIRPCVL